MAAFLGEEPGGPGDFPEEPGALPPYFILHESAATGAGIAGDKGGTDRCEGQFGKDAQWAEGQAAGVGRCDGPDEEGRSAPATWDGRTGQAL